MYVFYQKHIRVFPKRRTCFLDPYATHVLNGYGFNPARDYWECIPLNELTMNPNLVQNPG